MRYELWDVVTGNCLGRYPTEAAALERVDDLVRRHGVAYASDLELTVEDDLGAFRGSRTGNDILTRVEGALAPG